MMTISRSFDGDLLKENMKEFSKDWVGFDTKELIGNHNNILLKDESGNFALFEKEEPGEYYGHYLFKTRGYGSLKRARLFLDYFLKHYRVKELYGLTPVDHKGALRLNKALGFIEQEEVETINGPHIRVRLTKERLQT